MRVFWATTGWFAAVWIVYIAFAGMHELAVAVIGCALFFACIFLTDLFNHERPVPCVLLFLGGLLAALVTSWLISDDQPGIIHHLFQLFLASILTVRASHKLPKMWMSGFGCTAVILVLASVWLQYGLLHPLTLLFILYMLAFTALLLSMMTMRDHEQHTKQQYEALLNEYRALKRQAKQNEDAVRAEERTQITRQIHDSVGHKLTSLLMQIEMYRMRASGQEKEQLEQMKRLAKQSLNETRNAVKALREEEVGGIQALLRLIRNLEAESYMQIDFHIRHGALSVALNNEQSIAVYRAIQEALTNAMRHGSSRKVKILLESSGGRLFRFEVSNDTLGHAGDTIKEGFGLTAMRDRIEKAGGTLDIIQTNQQFLVRGSFLLEAGLRAQPK